MKKTLAIAALVAMVPFSAYAKTAITDTDMNKVTGQAGVSIDLDVRVDVSADTIAWGQNDGTNTNWIGMKNFVINDMTIKLRPDLLTNVVTDQLTLASNAQAAKGGDTAAIAAMAGLQAKLTADEALVKPFTIDVATVPALTTDGNKSAGTTYVRFGLGSLEIAAQNIDFTVALGKSTGTAAPTILNTAAATTETLSQELGSVHLGGLVLDLNGSSTVDIYSTNPTATSGQGSGVVFDLAVTIDSLKAASLSWGNTAGTVTGPSTSASSASAKTTAGFVGLSNLNIAALTLTGPISINVATVSSDSSLTGTAGALAVAFATAGGSATTLPTTGTAAYTAYQAALSAYYYSLYTTVGMSSSFVHFGLGTGNSLSAGSTLAANSGAFQFGMGSMTADVKVASNADLTTGGGTYGSIGISNLKVGVNGWVNIGAH